MPIYVTTTGTALPPPCVVYRPAPPVSLTPPLPTSLAPAVVIDKAREGAK